MTAALGFGVSGPHGQVWFSERKLQRLIAQAYAGGVRHFDTAPFYGEAEARLGRALKAKGARDVIVSTKTGTRHEGGRTVKDFSTNAIRADVDASLLRLHRDAIDILYLHGPSLAEIDVALPALLALKAEGKVKAIGVCGEGAALDHAIDRGVDAIMGVFNVIDRRHSVTFARAKSKGVATVAIAPLVQGAFAESSPPRSLSDLWRLGRKAVRKGPATELVERARAELPELEGIAPSAAALLYVLQSGVADFALTTTTKAAHLAQSLDAAATAQRSSAPVVALDP